jgi:hypothetical protein
MNGMAKKKTAARDCRATPWVTLVKEAASYKIRWRIKITVYLVWRVPLLT